ncbi:phosphoadenosine phosphosulfate reductase [Cognatiyoonia sp. IB215182]|uniref:phosphoadenosine phosphosulfate reductase n=1 Tax=Cognatiyoonia sp. IB215182 TaxID=3097353 RepID=UPI002A132CBC|nr:phosphoadenosine phosphosulfate reductase [Cognatiyoonia sp. IB215182]MDX8353276.1 phosphoadenosine phosphosulfate reductase [Cognatiyoonia sp. IB215182]
MDDRQLSFETDMVGLDTNAWLAELDGLCDDLGFFEQLGSSHFAGFLEAGNDLLVTFETVDQARLHNVDSEPRGFAYARHDGWSHLCLLSMGESWFRDKAVCDFFDRLVDDGFFEDFERIIFYGANGAGYAAAAFSVAAPGATVIALRPQATLDARLTGWDPRFKAARKQSFRGRYGYAPEMIDGAQSVFIVYDPVQRLDAAHAALFHKPHVTPLPCPLLGKEIDRAFDRMGIHDVMLKLAMEGALDGKRFTQLLRARRYDQTYVRTLVNWLMMNEHRKLAVILCDYMLQRGQDKFFAETRAALLTSDEAYRRPENP